MSEHFFDRLADALTNAGIYVIKTYKEKLISANGPVQAYIMFGGIQTRNKMTSNIAIIMIYSRERNGPKALSEAVIKARHAVSGVGVFAGSEFAPLEDKYLTHAITVVEDPR